MKENLSNTLITYTAVCLVFVILLGFVHLWIWVFPQVCKP